MTVQDRLAGLRGSLSHGVLRSKPIVSPRAAAAAGSSRDVPVRPRLDRALAEGQLPVGDDELRVDLHARAEAGAVGHAPRRVERERPRLQLLERQVVVAGSRCSENMRSRCGSSSARSTKSRTIAAARGRSAVSTESVSAAGRRASPKPVDDDRDVCCSLLLSWAGRPGGPSARRYVPASSPWAAVRGTAPVYSPLRPRITGASTWNRVPSSSSSTRSTICCGACAAIGRPHPGQCGCPIRAYSSRR